ncbi:MAG: DUF2188 domain-containing protein [Anaeroplasma sp.]|uniref:DUF2188 domain-containing protein n=1 Tax=Anaeroplasma sp. TaxID=1872523 RepID=UPI002A917D72|nr:DUF2188 domain-containing protein [Anaeroplasma sp.]MDY5983376.1 DUF2188 domain-containing protein [Anaeroplasma sp.]
MALFKSVPAISTQKDTSRPIGKKPEAKVTDADFEIKKPMSSLEEDEILKSKIKELGEDAPEEVYFEDEEDTPKIEEKKEAPKKEVKEAPKKEAKPIVKEEPKKEAKPIVKAEPKEEAKPIVKAEPKAEAKPEVKEEAKVEAKPEVKEEAKVEETRPLTPEEKKARQLENLRKARLAREAAKAKENENMAEDKTEKPRKLVTETKKPVDMSKMVMTAKPKKDTGGKTVYHVSKRGETREDRVWKVFIQESNKVIKLFDYQEEALEYAKQLAKNKKDGSYVILHGLNGKIRKY